MYTKKISRRRPISILIRPIIVIINYFSNPCLLAKN